MYIIVLILWPIWLHTNMTLADSITFTTQLQMSFNRCLGQLKILMGHREKGRPEKKKRNTNQVKFRLGR